MIEKTEALKQLAEILQNPGEAPALADRLRLLAFSLDGKATSHLTIQEVNEQYWKISSRRAYGRIERLQFPFVTVGKNQIMIHPADAENWKKFASDAGMTPRRSPAHEKET